MNTTCTIVKQDQPDWATIGGGIISSYQRAGTVETGSFAWGDLRPVSY